MARWLLGLWWIPAGMLVGLAVAIALGPGWVLFAVLTYVALNLLGTLLLLRELRDHEPAPDRNVERWELAVEVAFVLQLPVGIGVLLFEIL